MCIDVILFFYSFILFFNFIYLYLFFRHMCIEFILLFYPFSLFLNYLANIMFLFLILYFYNFKLICHLIKY